MLILYFIEDVNEEGLVLMLVEEGNNALVQLKLLGSTVYLFALLYKGC